MKDFIYAETTDGGIEVHDVNGDNPEADLSHLNGWMKGLCLKKDRDLLRWAATAKVGESKAHRLGILIRVKDKEPLYPTVNERAQKAFSKELCKRWAALEAKRKNKLFDHIVRIRHGDGSKFEFRHATGKEDGNYLYVFSEHNGATGFYLEDLKGWKQERMW